MPVLSELKNKATTICGEIKMLPVNSIPEGWLACTGTASRTTYAKLFAKIGTTYGVGDGSTTFNLPNLNSGRFIRGSGGNAASLGSAQAEDIGSHTHAIPNIPTGSAGSVTTWPQAGSSRDRGTPQVFSYATQGPSTPGVETRPANYAMVFCIKY